MKNSYTLLFLLLLSSTLFAQQTSFTRQDSLRGSLNKNRGWWDVLKYDLTTTPDYSSKTIKGSNIILFKVTKPGHLMQIDFQQPMQIDSVVWQSRLLVLKRDGDTYLADFEKDLDVGSTTSLRIVFSGKPREAKMPPWDGGWIWAKDQKGRPWMSVACQGLGASVWYPCKDHQSDEPDQGASISITVPDSLVAVSNGKLISTKVKNGLAVYTWSVTNPINNYNIIPYIGKYVHWDETFSGENGNLSCDYWVLDYELEKAKAQFQQVPKMLKCFEHWFGPYPFYEDGFKLVQSPHLGMEHQSAVAYGNKFGNGYLGRDLSQTGWGLKWDFIIVHESGHEWFGNSITTNDLADMWVHEGFTNYSETLFTTCEYGVEAGNDYLIGTRKLVANDIPIIATYGVNREGSGDMYYKGGNLVHTIRQVIRDDEKFRQLLRDVNKTFWHQTVTSQQIESYISQQSGINFSKTFDQYLRTTKIPALEYKIHKNKLQYRWTNCVSGFDLPLKIEWHGEHWIKPTEAWTTLKGPKGGSNQFLPDRNFFITTKMAD